MPEIELQFNAEAVQRLFAGLPARIRLKVIREGVRDVGRFSQRTLRSLTPRRTGRTRTWITARALSSERIHGDTVERRVRRPRIFNLLESGAKPHEIRPKGKRALRVGERLFGRVQHPGFAPRPIWGSVVEATRREASRVFGDRLAKVLAQRVA